jgi:hypothetical protein
MPSNSGSIPIVVVERNGDLRASRIESYAPLELSKKCKHKTHAGFEVRAEWAYSGTDAADRFIVELWARDDGPAGHENKYEFPPPVDTLLFFGACALVAKDMSSHHHIIPLTLEKWEKMYEFLFGGFDTLATCEDDDDDECDELDSMPAHRKTKDGYLKDGFVVDVGGDDDEDEDEDEDEDDDEDDDEDEDEDEDDDEDDDEDNPCTATPAVVATKAQKSKPLSKRRDKKQPREEVLVDTSSELSEEVYEYLDD